MSEDPRGPYRTIMNVSADVPGRVTLSCGHVRDWNPIYAYRVGDEHRCYACRATTQRHGTDEGA